MFQLVNRQLESFSGTEFFNKHYFLWHYYLLLLMWPFQNKQWPLYQLYCGVYMGAERIGRHSHYSPLMLWLRYFRFCQCYSAVIIIFWWHRNDYNRDLIGLNYLSAISKVQLWFAAIKTFERLFILNGHSRFPIPRGCFGLQCIQADLFQSPQREFRCTFTKFLYSGKLEQ